MAASPLTPSQTTLISSLVAGSAGNELATFVMTDREGFPQLTFGQAGIDFTPPDLLAIQSCGLVKLVITQPIEGSVTTVAIKAYR